MSSKKLEKKSKSKKLLTLFFFITVLLIILLFNFFKIISEKRDLPSLKSKKVELAVRGDIVSKDNFKISSSKKLYTASIDTRYLDPKKEELFLKLFTIYSNTNYQTIKEKLKKAKKHPGYIVLSYKINSRSAKNLKSLSYKLRKLKVFIPRKINGSLMLTALNISESGEKRIFSYDDILTPVIGYVRKFENKKGKTKVKGIKGLEKFYDKELNSVRDGLLKGNRDVASYVSFDKNSIINKRIDGTKLTLNIPLKLQRNNELTLDKFKEKLEADEIIATIVESHTGKVITMASSNRFNPQKIKQTDIPFLNVNAIEMPFEPGSIMKPLTISLVMDKNRIEKNELFYINNKGKLDYKKRFPRGKYKVDRFTIHDDHRFKKHFLSLNDIVIFSSNIGTLKIGQKLSGPEFYEGLKRFGFTRKTGIDLPYERKGIMPNIKQFSANDKENEDNIFKATVSYGQGITATSIQMIKAYTVFNNDGYMITPKIVSSLKHSDLYFKPYKIEKEKIILKKTALEMKQMLINTVNDGTGKAARIRGLTIGGKTGTAQIARGGRYLKKYISSFFGFVNDNYGNSYTIGVTVYNPVSTGEHWYYHYASSSAVPTFKAIIENLVKLHYLKIDKKN